MAERSYLVEGVVGWLLVLLGYNVAKFDVGIIGVGLWIMFSLWLAKKNPCCIGLTEGFFFMKSEAFIT